MGIQAAVLAYGGRTDSLRRVLDALERTGISRIAVVANQTSAATDRELQGRELGPTNYAIARSEINLGSAGGYAKAIALCLADPSCDAVWLLDDDNIPALDALARIHETYRDLHRDTWPVLACFRPDLPEMAVLADGYGQSAPSTAACAGFHALNGLSRLWKRSAERALKEDGRLLLHWSAYGGLVVPRKVVEICGMPEPAMFLYGDDLEWTSRMKSHGVSLQLLHHAVVRDSEPPWNARGRPGSNLSRRIRDLPAERVYYELRNKNWLSRHRFPGSRLVYAFNRTLYSFAALAIAIRYGRLNRFRLIMRALRDGEKGRLGKTF